MTKYMKIVYCLFLGVLLGLIAPVTLSQTLTKITKECLLNRSYISKRVLTYNQEHNYWSQAYYSNKLPAEYGKLTLSYGVDEDKFFDERTLNSNVVIPGAFDQWDRRLCQQWNYPGHYGRTTLSCDRIDLIDNDGLTVKNTYKISFSHQKEASLNVTIKSMTNFIQDENYHSQDGEKITFTSQDIYYDCVNI